MKNDYEDNYHSNNHVLYFRNKDEEYTIEYIVKVSIGLGTGCLFFGLSVIYFYMQYQVRT